nr:MAG TPA: hypothetical protein [Caudoviricetes sp.]
MHKPTLVSGYFRRIYVYLYTFYAGIPKKYKPLYQAVLIPFFLGVGNKNSMYIYA